MNPLSNRAQHCPHHISILAGVQDVFGELYPVAEPECPPGDQSVANRIDSGSLASVNRHRHQLLSKVIECQSVLRGWKASLWASDVKPDNALITAADGQLGYFE